MGDRVQCLGKIQVYHFNWNSNTGKLTIQLAGKFGGDNVWRKWMDEDYGKKIWQINRSTRSLAIKCNY